MVGEVGDKLDCGCISGYGNSGLVNVCQANGQKGRATYSISGKRMLEEQRKREGLVFTESGRKRNWVEGKKGRLISTRF